MKKIRRFINGNQEIRGFIKKTHPGFIIYADGNGANVEFRRFYYLMG
jgi:hypothetical protein